MQEGIGVRLVKISEGGDPSKPDNTGSFPAVLRGGAPQENPSHSLAHLQHYCLLLPADEAVINPLTEERRAERHARGKNKGFLKGGRSSRLLYCKEKGKKHGRTQKTWKDQEKKCRDSIIRVYNLYLSSCIVTID